MASLCPRLFVLATLLGLLHVQHAVGQGFSSSSGGTSSVGSRGGDTSTVKGGGKGDPLMTTFDGRTFEFTGEVGAYYNVISEKHHSVSMKLKLGQMWDHNGTYMDGIGFKHQDHEVVIEQAAGDIMHVYVDGKRLQMAVGETEQRHVTGLGAAGLMLLWQLYRPDMGQAVEITTDLLSMTVFLTPAGTRDEGGVIQPAYLNFDVVLLGPPANDMTGIVGESYASAVAGAAAPATAADFKFHGIEADYQTDSYFGVTHKHNRFGLIATVSPRRRLIERASVAFPLRASAGPAARLAATAVARGGKAARKMIWI